MVFTPAGARAFLGLSPIADLDAVKKAYRKQALKAHPDKVGGDKERFQRLHDAYRCVIGNQRRTVSLAAPRPAPVPQTHVSEASRLRARAPSVSNAGVPAQRLASLLFEDTDASEALHGLFPQALPKREKHLDRVRERARWSAEFSARDRDIQVLDSFADLQQSRWLTMPNKSSPTSTQPKRKREPAPHRRLCKPCGPCARASCPYYRTWHASHCCNNCARVGTHGPRCHKMARLDDQLKATEAIPVAPTRTDGETVSSSQPEEGTMGKEESSQIAKCAKVVADQQAWRDPLPPAEEDRRAAPAAWSQPGLLSSTLGDIQAGHSSGGVAGELPAASVADHRSARHSSSRPTSPILLMVAEPSAAMSSSPDVAALAARVKAMSRAERADALQALPVETRNALAKHMMALKGQK